MEKPIPPQSAAPGDQTRWRTLVVVVLVGLALSAVLFFEVRRLHRESLENLFAQLAAEGAGAITNKFLDDLRELDSVRRFYDASIFVDEKEFRLFVTPLLHSRGFRHVGWVEAEREGSPSILYLEPPFEGAGRGGETPFHPEFTQALQKALESREPVATPRIDPLGAQEGGIFVFIPVASSAATSPPLEHQDGAVLGAFRVEEGVGGALARIAPGLQITLLDLGAPAGEALLYRSGPSELSDPSATPFLFVHDFPFAQRPWRVEIRASADVLAEHTTLAPWWVPAAGIPFTLVLALLLASRQRKRALEISRGADRVESSLRESEERYRSVVAAMAEGIVMRNERGEIVTCNRAAEEILGVKEGELLGHTTLDLGRGTTRQDGSVFPPQDHPALMTLRTGRSQRNVVMGVRKPDGDLAWIQINTEPLTRPGEARPFGAVSSFSDVTERKMADDLLLAALAFETSEAILVTDAEGTILRVNRAFSQLTGYAAEEAIGQNPRILKSGRHDEEFYREMWESLRGPGRWEGEVWERRKDGGIYPKWLTIKSLRNEQGEITHYVATFFDISKRKAAEEKVERLAYYDPLTGLPNRILLLDRLTTSLARLRRSGECGALFFMDLDKFKELNDTRGHDAGDRLLKGVAERLSGELREEDTVARLGGDEFVVLLPELSREVESARLHALGVAEKLRGAIAKPFVLGDYEHSVGVSIGVTLLLPESGSIETLLKEADIAMYRAKAAGRNTVRAYAPSMYVEGGAEPGGDQSASSP